MIERVVVSKPDALPRAQPLATPPAGAKAVTGILAGTRFFRFRRAVRVQEHEKEGLWIHDCKPLGISAYAESRRASWAAFVTQFEATWDWLASEEDPKLTEGAQKLKRKYLDIVEAVEPVL